MEDMPITIIGAGIAGLTLARTLKHLHIPAVIYERAPSAAQRFSYSITLFRSTYSAPILNLNEPDFRSAISVDPAASSKPQIRANRWRLESLLREGLDIRYDCAVKEVHTESSGKKVVFGNGQSVTVPNDGLLVAADGVHSAIRRLCSPKSEPTALPYVVFNGKRRGVNTKALETESGGENVKELRIAGTLLQVSLNEPGSMSYTFSRVAKEGDEETYQLARNVSKATVIPSVFYAELAALRPHFTGVFADVFDVEKVKEDRLLHWLMRKFKIADDEAEKLEGQGVVVIGDAACTTPVLGSTGANTAMTDGRELAEWIAAGRKGRFMEGRWKGLVEDGERRLEEMHGGDMAVP